jgi:hypothetical protein
MQIKKKTEHSLRLTRAQLWAMPETCESGIITAFVTKFPEDRVMELSPTVGNHPPFQAYADA